MASVSRTIVLIPSRLASTRLPGKPLASIGGEAMIVQVWRRAVAAAVGAVAVACEDKEIAQAVEAAGGRAVMTKSGHPSGADRIHEALGILDPERTFDHIVNLQGDLPNIEPSAICRVLEPLNDDKTDIATLAAEITDQKEISDPNVVKVIAGLGPDVQVARALYFTRAIAPAGDGPLWHHIGLYAYKREALEKFVGLPPSKLEIRESLEQLRALEAGLHIDVVRVEMVPLGVDTPDDLLRARQLFESEKMLGQ